MSDWALVAATFTQSVVASLVGYVLGFGLSPLAVTGP